MLYWSLLESQKIIFEQAGGWQVDTTTTGIQSVPCWLTKQRVAFYSSCVLIVELGYLALRFVGAYVLNLPDFVALGWDHAVFWVASRLAIDGPAANAYDARLTEPVVSVLQHFVLHRPFPTPWIYPPTFLVVVLWLALFPFPLSYAIWTAIGVAFSGFALGRILRPSSLAWWLPVLAFPALWIDLMAGQNSLFTMGLAALAFVLLDRRPTLAGVCIGLLAIKPQLGIVFPVVLLIGRRWRVFSVALITVAIFCAVAGVVFGFGIFGTFLSVLPAFRKLVVNANWPGGLPTWFGFARSVGLSPSAAYLVHAIMGVPSLALAVFLFASRSRAALRSAAVALATLVCQPYLLGYDLVWLALPIAFLIVDGQQHGWLKYEVPVLVAVWLAPLGLFFPQLHFGLCMPLIMALLTLVLIRRAGSRRGATD